MIACTSLATAHAQTASDIINKHMQALGGPDVFAKVKSVYYEGTLNVMGNDVPTSATLLVGKGFKTVTTFNGMDIIQCFTDTSGWMVNPMAGQTDPTPMPADMVKNSKSALTIGNYLSDYKANGFKDSLLGRESFDSVNAFKVKLSKPDLEITYWFDPNTFYILKTESKTTVSGQDVTTPTTYSGYKKTDVGYVVPTVMGVSAGGMDMTITYTKVEVNKEVDPKIFVMPSK